MIQSEVRIRSFRSQPKNLRRSMMMKIGEKHAGNGSLVGKSQLPLGEKHQANDKPEANGKAEVSPKQEADGKGDTPRKSLNLYSWQEIQRHNQEADQWLVINRKVYDVTSWADRHPGGRRVLNHYAGEDATVRDAKFYPLCSSCWVGGTLTLFPKACQVGAQAPQQLISSQTNFSGFLSSKDSEAT